MAQKFGRHGCTSLVVCGVLKVQNYIDHVYDLEQFPLGKDPAFQREKRRKKTQILDGTSSCLIRPYCNM